MFIAILSVAWGAFVKAAPTNLKPPKLIHFVEAVYPPEKQKAGITAQVVLSIAIGEDGKVTDVSVVEGATEDFNQAALAAAGQFIFSPAELDGQAIPVKITYRYDFTVTTQLVAVGPQVNFDGVVLHRTQKKPLSNVQVTIKNLNLSTQTDEKGAFAFTDVPAGKHTVELRHNRLATVLTDEILAPGRKRTMTYYAEERDEEVDEEVVVRAARIKKEAVETSIRTAEARKVPGTQGDTLKVVLNLPGVARASLGSGELLVWGSSARETRVNVEGVELPQLYHMGGHRSTVASDLVKSIDLSPGVFGAAYGRGLGGLVRVELAPIADQGIHGSVSSDVMDSAAVIQGAVSRRVRFAVAGRVSYLDKVMAQVSSKDIGDFFPIPRYDDYQARLTLDLRKDEILKLGYLASDDHLRRTIPSSVPGSSRSQDNDTAFRRLIATWARLFEDGSSAEVTASLGRDHRAIQEAYGGVESELNSATWHYALRASSRRRVAQGATVTLGVDVQGRSVALQRRGSFNQPAREGDIVAFGQRPSLELGFDAWKVRMLGVGGFMVLDISLGNWTLTPGLRLEPTAIEGDRLRPSEVGAVPLGYARLDTTENPGPISVLRYFPNPRLQLAWKASSRLTLTMGMGIYGQPPDPEDMSPVFGNPSLVGSRAIHGMTGCRFKLLPTMTLETAVFHKSLQALPSRNENPSPPEGQFLTQDGTGRVRGVQVLLRQELFQGFMGWITYTLSRSERRDHPQQPLRLFDKDQTHTFSFLASYELGFGVEVGVRFQYATGMPRTPVVGSYLNGRSGGYEPVFGRQNSIRIPAFYQLDAKVEKGGNWRGIRLSGFLDMQNLTYRKNPEEIIYSLDFREKDFISGLPTLAILGMRIEF